MMYINKGVLYRLEYTPDKYGVPVENKIVLLEVYTSLIQEISRAHAIKEYGPDFDINCQVFTAHVSSEDIYKASHIDLQGKSYFIKEVLRDSMTTKLLLREII